MQIAGVDCSTKKIAIFYINSDGSCETTEITSKKEDTSVRINDMFEAVCAEMKRRKPDMVYVENSPYLQNIKVTLAIHSVVDSVRFACVLAKVAMQTIEVTSWKKACCGNGRAEKSDVMQWAKLKYGDKLITSQDIADAAGVASFGWNMVKG
jgi:Holliday junction resolvasome RuvABC endonuclease subunit